MEVLKNVMRMLMLSSMVIVSFGFADKQGDFQPPSLDGYKYVGSLAYDVDKDGVKESTLIMYKNMRGDKIFKTKTTGRVWRWTKKSLNYSQNFENTAKNYSIVDGDCDGSFDTKYGSKENMDLPSCVK